MTLHRHYTGRMVTDNNGRHGMVVEAHPLDYTIGWSDGEREVRDQFDPAIWPTHLPPVCGGAAPPRRLPLYRRLLDWLVGL